VLIKLTKYRRHTDPNGRYDQKEIKRNKGLNYFKQKHTRQDKSLPAEKTCDLIKMILTMNNFSFNNEHYLQKHGTAMGTRIAPSYANLFMGKFEQQAIDNSFFKPFIW